MLPAPTTSIWNPSTARNINAIEKVNRCGARFVCNDYKQRSIPTAMMKKLKWNTLQDRRRVNDLCQMHKISHEKFGVSFDDILSPLPQHTRSNHRAYINDIQPTCDAMRNNFFPRVIPPWNRLPPALVDIPETKPFRKEVTTHLQLY